jgi:hypothetical protein
MEAGGPASAGWDGGRLLCAPRRKAAAALKAAMTKRAHQPAEECRASRDHNFSAARGGVIARVWSSMRQKSNRPLRSMQRPTTKAIGQLYHC